MTQEELRQAEEEEAEAPHDEWDERSAHREARGTRRGSAR